MDRNAVIEECAVLLDGLAAHYDGYAAKYDDEDGARAGWQAHTCRNNAASVRTLKSK